MPLVIDFNVGRQQPDERNSADGRDKMARDELTVAADRRRAEPWSSPLDPTR